MLGVNSSSGSIVFVSSDKNSETMRDVDVMM